MREHHGIDKTTLFGDMRRDHCADRCYNKKACDRRDGVGDGEIGAGQVDCGGLAAGVSFVWVGEKLMYVYDR